MIKHIVNLITSKVRRSLRSPKWRTLERKIIKENGYCASCKSTKHLQVHHIKPFKDNPDLELDPTNLIILCMDTNECHLTLGHGNSFRCYNPNIVEDIKNISNNIITIDQAKVNALANRVKL